MTNDDLNAFPQFPDCVLCSDSGIHGGADRPFAFCLCVAGEKRRAAEPGIVDESNRTREGLGIR